MSESPTPRKTVALIHGTFVTRHCWDRWVARYEAQGYTCHALAYPGRERPVAELKERAGYEADIVPESRPLARSGLSKAARIDFSRPHAPLLFLAGEKDHIMPASLNRTNFRRYAKSPSRVEYKEFRGRAHYSILAGKGWEEVADHALDWAVRADANAASLPGAATSHG